MITFVSAINFSIKCFYYEKNYVYNVYTKVNIEKMRKKMLHVELYYKIYNDLTIAIIPTKCSIIFQFLCVPNIFYTLFKNGD